MITTVRAEGHASMSRCQLIYRQLIYRQLIYRYLIPSDDMSKPMREATLLTLADLADQDLHGYGIIGEVKQLSGGRVTLGPGTLYGTLDRPFEQGLIRPTGTEVVNGRLRRYYGITGSGLSAVRAEAVGLRAIEGSPWPHGRPAFRQLEGRHVS